MPELPKVETVARGLQASLLGRTIVGVELWQQLGVLPDILRATNPPGN